VVSSPLDIVVPKPSRFALCEVPGRKVHFVGFHRLSLSGTDHIVHGSIDRLVLQTGLLRMLPMSTCLVVRWVMTTYCLASDLELAGELRRLRKEELHDLYS